MNWFFQNKIESALDIAKQNFAERAMTGTQINTALGRRQDIGKNIFGRNRHRTFKISIISSRIQ